MMEAIFRCDFSFKDIKKLIKKGSKYDKLKVEYHKICFSFYLKINFLFIAFLFDEFFLPQRSRETACVQQEACSQSEIISAPFSKVTAAPEKTTTRKQWQVKNQFCIWGWSRAAAR